MTKVCPNPGLCVCVKKLSANWVERILFARKEIPKPRVSLLGHFTTNVSNSFAGNFSQFFWKHTGTPTSLREHSRDWPNKYVFYLNSGFFLSPPFFNRRVLFQYSPVDFTTHVHLRAFFLPVFCLLLKDYTTWRHQPLKNTKKVQTFRTRRLCVNA